MRKLFRNNEGIWRLMFVAAIKSHRHRCEIEFLIIRPNASYPRNWSFTEANRNISKITVGFYFLRGSAAALCPLFTLLCNR